eukprot:CCRYP_018218-RA/>CCRYP_018218-RA protein AED:0.19 eAED:-0.29 QI:0/-1/0/1/-1/1/1/0/426
MEDLSRCFTVPDLPEAIVNRHDEFQSFLENLCFQCFSHYKNSHRHRASIYLGSLGTCALVRYRLSQPLSRKKSPEERNRNIDLLRNAHKVVQDVLRSYPSSPKVTLLEGERVGALALQAAINHSLLLEGNHEAEELISSAKRELLLIGSSIVQKLPRGECELLYGRAGFLHALAFVRYETGHHDYGKELVKKIISDILDEGKRMANETGLNLNYLWEWHGKMYLGAAHGVVGILFTLLCFQDEVVSVAGSMDQIRETIWKLGDMCFESGNLKPSLTDTSSDRLVHFCHGSPGHILLLVKSYQVYDDVRFLERAEEIARSVLCRRGILRKGVGLCHGISGNAYCFLSLYRARKREEEKQTVVNSCSSDQWLIWAHHFLSFAVSNFEELSNVPDHPYSLYEGAGGLVTLIHDMKDPRNSRFPCFELHD